MKAVSPRPLCCANGEPWIGPHPLCEAEVDRACAAFDVGVLAGRWDAHGYTPQERKARQRTEGKKDRHHADAT